MPPNFLKHFDCIQCSIHIVVIYPPLGHFSTYPGSWFEITTKTRLTQFWVQKFSDEKIRPLCNQDRFRRRSGIHKSFIKSMVGHKIMSLLSNGAKISGSWKPQNSSCVPLKYMTNLLFWGVETFEYFTGL